VGFLFSGRRKLAYRRPEKQNPSRRRRNGFCVVLQGLPHGDQPTEGRVIPRAIKNGRCAHGASRALDLVKPPTMRERALPLCGGRNSNQTIDIQQIIMNFHQLGGLFIPFRSATSF